MRRRLALAVLVATVLATSAAVRSCDDDAAPLSARGEGVSTDADEPAPSASPDALSLSEPHAPERRRVHPATAARARHTAVDEQVSPSGFRLQVQRRTARGTVVDEDGRPRADVRVHLISTWLDVLTQEVLESTDLAPRHLVTSLRTGTDGRFELSYVEGGRATLVAGETPDAPLAVLPLNQRSGDVDLVQVVPREPGTVIVTVTGPEGAPIAATPVRLVRETGWSPPAGSSIHVAWPTALTDADGVARLERAAPGPAALALGGVPPGAAPQVVVPAGGEARVDVVLHPVRTLAVTVVSADTGLPLPGAMVRDMAYPLWRSFTTGDDGRCEVSTRAEDGIPVSLRVTAEGHASAGVLWELRGEGPQAVEVRLDPLATLRLRCVDASGRPLRDVTAQVRHSAPTQLNMSWIALDEIRVAARDTDDAGRVDLRVPADTKRGVAAQVLVGGVHRGSIAPVRLAPGAVSDVIEIVIPDGD